MKAISRLALFSKSALFSRNYAPIPVRFKRLAMLFFAGITGVLLAQSTEPEAQTTLPAPSGRFPVAGQVLTGSMNHGSSRLRRSQAQNAN